MAERDWEGNKRMKEKKITFKIIYLCLCLCLILVVAGVLLYVNRLLHRYEQLRPEQQVQQVMDQLAEDAAGSEFWKKYALPQVEAGEYEQHMDVQQTYQQLYTQGDMDFTVKNGTQGEDELLYQIRRNGTPLAEVRLKAKGPAETKLAVLSFREWEVANVRPLFQGTDYTLSLPDDFRVWVNGIEIPPVEEPSHRGEEVTYTLEQLYLPPELEIKDHTGERVNYVFKGQRIEAEFYNYALTLPKTLQVTLDGVALAGEAVDEYRTYYQIRTLKKPMVTISDAWGNRVEYQGENHLPLTYMNIRGDAGYTVQVLGAEVPEAAVVRSANPEYSFLQDYVEQLPEIKEYKIAILMDDAEITVRDEQGEAVALSQDKTVYDFVGTIRGQDQIPEQIAKEVDVLLAAQNWSLFMSNDLPFEEASKHLLAGSYQYEVAGKYATGVDIRFTSEHTLVDPAFTDVQVTNYMQLADNCFSVDISFVKHMRLRTGRKVDDPMNDRFYFVKYDDTDDDVDNPGWKIAGMKEIVSNE